MEIRLKLQLHFVDDFDIVVNGLVVFRMGKLESVLHLLGLLFAHGEDSELFLCLIRVEVARLILLGGQTIWDFTRNGRQKFQV